MSIWLMTGWKWSGRSVYLRDCIRTIQRFYVTLRKILNQRGMLLRSFDNIHEKENLQKYCGPYTPQYSC